MAVWTCFVLNQLRIGRSPIGRNVDWSRCGLDELWFGRIPAFWTRFGLDKIFSGQVSPLPSSDKRISGCIRKRGTIPPTRAA